MLTPIQQLIVEEQELTRMFDSDVRVAMSLLEMIRKNKSDWTQQEKTIICQSWIDGFIKSEIYNLGTPIKDPNLSKQAEDYYLTNFKQNIWQNIGSSK